MNVVLHVSRGQHSLLPNQRFARCELTCCLAKSTGRQRYTNIEKEENGKCIRNQGLRRRPKHDDSYTEQTAKASEDDLQDGGQQATRPPARRKLQPASRPARRLLLNLSRRSPPSLQAAKITSSGSGPTGITNSSDDHRNNEAGAPAASSATSSAAASPQSPTPSAPSAGRTRPVHQIPSAPAASTLPAAAPASPSTPSAGSTSPDRSPHGLVHVLWDLDNKYPLVLDHEGLVRRMRASLSKFGQVVEILAYCNYQTLNHVPYLWDMAMEAGMEHPLGDYLGGEPRCPLCHRRFDSPLGLERHFKQLHEREHKKRLAHKPDAYLEANHFRRYEAARQEVLSRKRGFHLEGILKKAGVVVVPVQMGPQKADVALERDAKQLMAKVKAPPLDSDQARPVLVLVSDDRGFEPLLKLFLSQGWVTVVVSSGTFRNASERVAWEQVVGNRFRQE